MGEHATTFQRQHDVLKGLGADVLVAMQRPSSSEAVREVRRLMARFKGTLLVHQRMENEAVYPRLLNHADAAIATEARSLYDELGGLYDELIAFEQRFDTNTIEAAPFEYYGAIRALLKHLWIRMQREDETLYALVTRADATSAYDTRLAPDEALLDALAERKRWQALGA